MEGNPFGRYRLVDLLGRGGMGEVWRAHDAITDRTVAVKVLPAQLAQDEVFQQRFRREAHAAARLTEPHVVPIHSFGEIEGRLYVEMRLIEGADLQTLLTRAPLDPTRAVMIIEQVAQALDAAHQIGLVHRDVKPSNILITNHDFAYLIDFGIARAADETGLTSTGKYVGTLRYMAPERFGDDHIDARADVYSLACVLQQCLTGREPFLGDSVEQQIAAHLTKPPPQPSTMRPGLPGAFDAVIAKGMAKDPRERYQTSLELAWAARAAIDMANPTPASAASAPAATEPAQPTTQRRPVPFTGSVADERIPTPTPAGAQTKAPTRPPHEDLSVPPDHLDRTGGGSAIDDLLDRAVSAINRGDRAVATALAGQVLAVDESNVDAEDLLGAPTDAGEIRRLTILCADLVDSTGSSAQAEPETYRLLVGRYRDQVLRVVDRYDGHLGSTRGDGLLVVFGYPNPHENDVHRAVQAGLEITREVARLSEQAKRRLGVEINVRVGVHRGLVYLDTAQEDMFGLAVNLAGRVSGLASPGAVVVSDAVEPLIRDAFEVENLPPASVKDVDGLINHSRVVGERVESAPTQLGPLVGRDRELARLAKSWARAQAGTLTTPGVVFRGEPGIGKSRLASAASELVQRDSGVVLELVGSPFHSDAGLHPVRTLLERRCGINRLTEPGQRLELLRAEVAARPLDSEAAVPLLAPVLGIAPQHGYEPVPAEGRKLQDLIAEAVREYLLACFDQAPGLLLVEDMHWFDPSTAEVLGGLLGGTGGRLLIVLTGRDGDWLSNEWPVKVVDLTPLTDEQSDALILALDPTVSADDRAAVRARCDGVPFYIEQVVSGLGTTDAENRPPVPDPLYEPLFARLHTTPNVVPVVEAAAIIGRHFDRDLLVAVSGIREDEVDDVIDELEDARVLEPWGTDSWRFRHELLREVAAELAPPSVRQGLHAKVAEALIEGAAGEPDWRLVAAHYEYSQRYADAASAYQQACADARRRGALTEARTYLDYAITQLENCPPGPKRDRSELDPRLQRGFLAAAAEGYQSPAVATDFERCLQLAGTDLRDDKVFATLLAVISYYVPRADLLRASQLLELLNTAALEHRPWFRPAIESGLGMVAYQRGHFDVARGHFEQAAVGLAEDDKHHFEELWFIPDDPVVLAHEHLGLCHILHGDLHEAEAEFGKAFRRAGELAFPQGPYSHVYATDLQILVLTEASQFDTARVLVADLLERAERYGFDFWQMFGLTEQCMVDSCELLTSAEPDAAALSALIDSMTGFIELWRALGLNAYQTQYDCILARLLLSAGRPQVAKARIATALQLAEDTDMHMYDAELLRVRARTQADPVARAADLTAAIELSRRQDAPLFELRAALDDFELRGEPARAGLAAAAERLPADSALPESEHAKVLLDS